MTFYFYSVVKKQIKKSTCQFPECDCKVIDDCVTHLNDS